MDKKKIEKKSSIYYTHKKKRNKNYGDHKTKSIKSDRKRESDRTMRGLVRSNAATTLGLVFRVRVSVSVPEQRCNTLGVGFKVRVRVRFRVRVKG